MQDVVIDNRVISRMPYNDIVPLAAFNFNFIFQPFALETISYHSSIYKHDVISVIDYLKATKALFIYSIKSVETFWL